ncbi:hypothetical protein KMC60_gp54 [Achromobacter phage vB_AxyP_19-32_Axy11]|uniref:Uncharacterized protein n=2 Tax=Pourcelvirus Axy11 TaxID=2843622 RepID=A0A514CVX3_9CAUD|nr:hypothetical protein KMC60_gp54 [Achromobacter phage vB_AxyP_19-32_Axy11]QDH84022.1 hypothetical protein Axy11_061 [Achromobacter phage vB_AxyP_19-32_Axy11]QDH84618.1 hypothetical protein Axy22_058 [Achromobacter phage vB_AxyP_19-32_Axy22]
MSLLNPTPAANGEDDQAKSNGATEATNTAPAGNDNDDLQVDELALLKQRATLMGVKFSNNISVETLKAKIAEHEAKRDAASAPVNPLAQATGEDKPEVELTPAQFRTKLRLEQTRLVRVRIQNLDPKKKDLPGEILTVANEYIGTIRKFVPYGEQTDNGYHIPWCIYQMMKERKFLNIRVGKDRAGREKVETSWVREFAIEVLPPLTQDELDDLRKAQIAAGSTNGD